MSGLPDLRTWVLLWFAVAVVLVWRHWRAHHGVGLLLAYVINLSAIHWLAPASWLVGGDAMISEVSIEGLRVAAIGLVAFAVGAEFARRRADHSADAPQETDEPVVDPQIINYYLAAGLLIQVVLFPMARGLATITALMGTGSSLVVAAVGLKCWNAWHLGQGGRLVGWLVASLALPVFTVATQGFLGYGMAAMMTIYVFVAALSGPRLKVLIGAAVLAVLGLSVYVTYMRDRSDIRSVVWTGSSLTDRLSSLQSTVENAELFDVTNPEHLDRIDERLNQNQLVGAAVHYIGDRYVTFAYGETVYAAALNMVPRALWPNKPVSAGSGDLVSTYTGITFLGETSVGIGHVLEWFINFGRTGVAVGFFIFGFVIYAIDRTARTALSRGEIVRFLMFYLPGLALLNVGGSFAEMTSTGAAALVMAVGLNRVIDRRTTRTPRSVAELEAAP